MSTINDLSSGKLFHISKVAANFLTENQEFDITSEEHSPFEGYCSFIDLLLQNNLITSLDLTNFIEVNENYKILDSVNHCILDYSKESKYSLAYHQKALSLIGVKHIQMRFFDDNYFKELVNALKVSKTNNLSIVSYEVLINFYSQETIQDELNLLSGYNRLRTVIVFYQKKKPILKVNNFHFTVHVVDGTLTDHRCCGTISAEYFILNRYSFNESKKFNNCLNNKISIDANGDIRNCPSMSKSFGNIKDTFVDEAINNYNFKEYWKITKDDIEVCKDCEFRYVCTDCRAYTENPTDKYSKPLKCGYNPYTNKWEDWSTNPLKEKAIKYYELEL